MLKCELCINSDKPEICTNCKDFNKFQTDSTHKQEDAPEPTPDLPEEQVIKFPSLRLDAVADKELVGFYQDNQKMCDMMLGEHAKQIVAYFAFSSPDEIPAIERAAKERRGHGDLTGDER